MTTQSTTQPKAIFKGKTIIKTKRGYEVDGNVYFSLNQATAAIKGKEGR